jgi:hypothetical protein
LLEERAVQDDNQDTRIAALRVLAGKWPDEKTRARLRERALRDPQAEARGAAFSALGSMHPPFGFILPTKYLSGLEPYLDPLQEVPREHIERAAETVGIRPDDIDAQVKSLSAFVGWDITRGAKPTG